MIDLEPKTSVKLPKNKSAYYYRPAIPICLALISGICAGDWFPGGDIWALGVALCGVALILRRVGTGKSAGKIPLGLVLALGYFSIQPYVAPILPSNHVVNFANGTSYEITGRVITTPEIKNSRQKAVLAVESLSAYGAVQRVHGNLHLTAFGDAEKIYNGDYIRINGKIKTLRNFKNPGGFDYERHMAFKGVRASTYCRCEDIHRLARGIHDWGIWGLGLSRPEVASLIDKATAGRPQTQAVLSALLIGKVDTISQELRDRFNRCGVSHILAISGLHVGIVSMAAFWLFSNVLVFVPALLWHGIGRRLAAVLALIPILYYGWLAGFSPSTQRAVLMVAVLWGAYLVGRRGDIFNTLAWAAVVILILHPPTLFSVSFQLSFMSVLSIIAGMRRFGKKTEKQPGPLFLQIFLRLYQIALVSIFALLGTLPLTMYYFNQVSLMGPLANLAVIPLLGFMAVPLGLSAIFIAPLSSYLAGVLLHVSASVVDLSIKLVDLLSAVPWISLRTFTPSLLEIFLYFLILVVFFWGKHLYFKRVIIWGIFFAVVVDSLFWAHERFFDPHLRATFLDVGQGNAAVLELPRGKTIIVDGGGFSDNENFDVGARIVAPYLRRRKIHTVDLMVLTHPNSDHLNGLLYVLENFKVQSVLSNDEIADTTGYQQFQKLLVQKKVHHPDFKTVPKRQQYNGVVLDILNPPIDYANRKVVEPWRNLNNNSLVLKLSYGNQSLLFAGDLMIPAETALLTAHPPSLLQSTVLVAPHHGSKSSSSRALVEAVKPQIVVVSAGWKNPFGFPHAEVLETYHDNGARILRTDQCGAIRLVLDGRNKIVDITQSCREA